MGSFQLSRQPVVLNYRFASSHQATRVPRRDIHLRQCTRCGLIFNASFSPEVIPYDENYENRQCFSPAFVGHLEQLAADLTTRYSLKKSTILEVGCGKGDFLRLICRTAQARGVGYDTSFEEPEQPPQERVTFHKKYLHSTEVSEPFAAVICRHVIEHVPDIREFLIELHAIAQAAQARVVLLETPRFEWIARHVAVWDIFYEHCNYFPSRSLAYLCRLAGFRVLRQRAVFGGQYQTLELVPARSQRAMISPGIDPDSGLSRFARRAGAKLKELQKSILQESGGKKWAIWGAGAKGVAMVNQLGKQLQPTCVIDTNPLKQGGVIPGSTVPIIAPDNPLLPTLQLILIANPNYASEIREVLEQRRFPGKVAVL